MMSTLVSAPTPLRTFRERHLLHVLKSPAPSKWRFFASTMGWYMGGTVAFSTLTGLLLQAGFLHTDNSWYLSFFIIPIIKGMYEMHKWDLRNDCILEPGIVAPDVLNAFKGISKNDMNKKQLYDRLGADEMLRVRKTLSLVGNSKHAIPTEVIHYLTDIGQRLRESGISIHPKQKSKSCMRVMSTNKASQVKALLSGYAPSAKLIAQDTDMKAVPSRLDAREKSGDGVLEAFLSCVRTDSKDSKI